VLQEVTPRSKRGERVENGTKRGKKRERSKRRLKRTGAKFFAKKRGVTLDLNGRERKRAKKRKIPFLGYMALGLGVLFTGRTS